MIVLTCNNVPRLVIDAYQLSNSERKEFDYINWDAIERGEDNAEFFRYKGQLYHIGDAEMTPHSGELFGWDGMYTETFFSGILFKFTDEDFDHVIVGRYFVTS